MDLAYDPTTKRHLLVTLEEFGAEPTRFLLRPNATVERAGDLYGPLREFATRG